MKRLFNILLVSCIAMAGVSCSSDTALIDAGIAGAQDKDVVIKKLEVNREIVLDTIRADAKGNVSYRYSFSDRNPEFIYLYYGNRRLGSFIIMPGDRISVKTDTLGYAGTSYMVKGSEESVKLTEYEKEYAAVLSGFNSLAAEYAEAIEKNDGKTAEDLQYKLGAAYVKAKQNAIKYIFKNIRSFSSIPVIYGNINGNLPVFADAKDGLFFKRLYDSLSVEYPTSKYVVSLLSEYERRQNILNLSDRFSNIETSSFPDIVLPDINAEYKSLSSLEGKPIVLYFWTITDVNQKMFNQKLKAVYEKYKDAGLQIYQVCLDMDKTAWANTVRTQELPWINVCDGLGISSPAAKSYNIGKVPSIFYIAADGDIKAKDEFENPEKIIKTLF